MAQEVIVTGTKLATMSELGDYKLYAVPEPTTVAAHQSKQVMMLDTRKIPFERIYAFRMNLDNMDSDEPESATVMLRLENKRSSRLGKPLPAGTISVLEQGMGGQSVLTGEKSLNDTPVGLPLEIELGEAMDVWTQTTLREDKTVKRNGREVERGAVDVLIGNDKPVPVQFEVTLANPDGKLRIVGESKRHTLKDGRTLWSFKLKPGARERLSYTVEQTDD
jgi:hypothetical protein